MRFILESWQGSAQEAMLPMSLFMPRPMPAAMQK